MLGHGARGLIPRHQSSDELISSHAMPAAFGDLGLYQAPGPRNLVMLVLLEVYAAPLLCRHGLRELRGSGWHGLSHCAAVFWQ